MHSHKIILGAAAAAFALCADVPPHAAHDAPGYVSFSAASAQPERRASRRTARRTSRRVNRRDNYINTLPAGCVRRGAYWYCGGIYYQSVVQDGRTVYVVVNL